MGEIMNGMDDSYALHDIHEVLRETVDACIEKQDADRLFHILEVMTTELYWFRKWRDQGAKI